MNDFSFLFTNTQPKNSLIKRQEMGKCGMAPITDSPKWSDTPPPQVSHTGMQNYHNQNSWINDTSAYLGGGSQSFVLLFPWQCSEALKEIPIRFLNPTSRKHFQMSMQLIDHKYTYKRKDYLAMFIQWLLWYIIIPISHTLLAVKLLGTLCKRSTEVAHL